MNEDRLKGAPSELQTDFWSPHYSASVPHIGDHSEGFLHNLSEVNLFLSISYILYKTETYYLVFSGVNGTVIFHFLIVILRVLEISEKEFYQSMIKHFFTLKVRET